MKKQAHAYYSGQVQGIGFRFTAERIAEEMGIVGWVSNLSDGRVELVAEANVDSLNDFLSQLNNIFKRYIQDINISWESASGEFKDFGIKF
ncbi:MAG: acylphosphatase [Candidatus Omnitrophica bacterium]|nr:acylphosphatase [Candidatus Omnitrophota bacterium]